MQVDVGVFGATGYAGREAVRLLSVHPRCRVAFATGRADGHVSHEEGLSRRADAYLLALPHGVSGSYAETLRASFPAAAVVDLSADLRLPTAAEYAAWYQHQPPAPALLGRAPYGLTEWSRDAVRGARLVANPGCYATAMALPLLPLFAAGLVEDDVVVDAKSGATGAGKGPREDLLFCELADDFSAYAPGRSHRHIGEVEAALFAATGRRPSLTFCPHLLPVKRGILATLYVRTPHPAAALREAIAARYAGERFVHVVDAPPRLSDVAHTNDSRISVHDGGPGRVVVFSAIDNLGKGAAGQAIQNLNLALGLEEGLGLPSLSGGRA